MAEFREARASDITAESFRAETRDHFGMPADHRPDVGTRRCASVLANHTRSTGLIALDEKRLCAGEIIHIFQANLQIPGTPMTYTGHVTSKAFLDLNGRRIDFQKDIHNTGLGVHLYARKILNPLEGYVILPLN
jgi:hypothetical protein